MNDVFQEFERMLSSSIGYDAMLDRIRTTPQVNSFPPYNIVANGDDLRLEVAVAGYKPDHIDIEYENGILRISRTRVAEVDKTEDRYVCRNIAERNFNMKFTLADTVVIDSANFVDGILTIYMHNELPEHLKSRKIPIDVDGRSDEQLLTE